MNVTVHAAETSTDRLLAEHLPRLLRAAGDVSARVGAVAVPPARGGPPPARRRPGDRLIPGAAGRCATVSAW